VGNKQGIYMQRFDNKGGKVGDEVEVHVTTDEVGHEFPSVAALAGGTFVVAWHGPKQAGALDTEVFAKWYDSDMTVLMEKTMVNSTTLDNQFGASAGESALDMGFVVAWVSNEQDGTEGGVYHQRFDMEPSKIGSENQTNTISFGNQTDAVLASYVEGGFIVAWTGPEPVVDTDVYHRRYDWLLEPEGPETVVNTYNDGIQGHADMATLTDQGYVVVWESAWQDGGGWGVYGQSYLADGTKSGPEFKVNTHTASDQMEPAVTAFYDGSFLVVWAGVGDGDADGGIYAQMYGPDGKAVDDNFRVSRKITETMLEPDVAWLAGMDFVVTWTAANQDSDGSAVMALRFKNDLSVCELTNCTTGW